tara:strand:- start:24 stop:203 length:180 start_codon:yes stop_codon:yes gene_type:complete
MWILLGVFITWCVNFWYYYKQYQEDMGVDKVQEIYREKQVKEPPQFVDSLFTARVGGTK